MNTIEQIRAKGPVSVLIEHYISTHPEVVGLENQINNGNLTVMQQLEVVVSEILEKEIEDFFGKDTYQSQYLMKMKMLVRTKIILAKK